MLQRREIVPVRRGEMVVDQVLDGRDQTQLVRAIAIVRQGDDHHAAGTDQPIPLQKDPDRIGTMFKDVVRDQEVRAVREVGAGLGHRLGGNHLGLEQLFRLLVGPQVVVPRRGARRQLLRIGAAADLDALARQEALGELDANIVPALKRIGGGGLDRSGRARLVLAFDLAFRASAKN